MTRERDRVSPNAEEDTGRGQATAPKRCIEPGCENITEAGKRKCNAHRAPPARPRCQELVNGKPCGKYKRGGSLYCIKHGQDHPPCQGAMCTREAIMKVALCQDCRDRFMDRNGQFVFEGGRISMKRKAESEMGDSASNGSTDRMDHENSPEDKPKDDITALKDLVRAKELTKVARIRMEKARAKLEQAEEHEKKLSADVKLIIELD